MLKVEQETTPKEATVEIDEYIPFRIIFNSTSPQPPYYWHAGNGINSLCEIGLNRKTGVILSITLTSIKSENVTTTKDTLRRDHPETQGHPVVDISDWTEPNSSDHEYADNFKDETCSGMNLIIGHGHITLLFTNKDTVARYIRSGRIRFGITSDRALCSVDITDFDSSDIETIKNAIL